VYLYVVREREHEWDLLTWNLCVCPEENKAAMSETCFTFKRQKCVLIFGKRERARVGFINLEFLVVQRRQDCYVSDRCIFVSHDRVLNFGKR
jgi:hypothetical protein